MVGGRVDSGGSDCDGSGDGDDEKEYIQASSRVGRKKSRPPGIVFTLYSATKPRDRSHYESFRSYHQALYRYVEPTSVTPWAMPAVERALHASLIALVRMSGYLQDNKSARHFDKNTTEFKSLRSIFERRIEESMTGMNKSEQDKVFSYLQQIIDEWHDKANCSETPIKLYEAGVVRLFLFSQTTASFCRA